MTSQLRPKRTFAAAVMGSDALAARVVSPEIDAALTSQPPEVREYVRRTLAQKERETPK